MSQPTAAEASKTSARRTYVTDIRKIWVLTDGKAGDMVQALGVTEALGIVPEIRQVAPRKPWVWLMPKGPIDPKEDYLRDGSPIAQPFPDLVIATGRRTVPYLRRVRSLSPNTFTVFLKDPRTGAGTADFIWVPEHDTLRGENVLVTLTSPHRCGTEPLQKARENVANLLPNLQGIRIVVVLGGNSINHKWTNQSITEFVQKLNRFKKHSACFFVTPSRRTPPELLQAVQDMLTYTPHYIWDGSGENPYLAMLATADHIVVTADSVNMIGEALTTGKPVYVFEPEGGHRKFEFFLSALKKRKAILPLDGSLQTARYAPINSTAIIATEIRRRFALWRARANKREKSTQD